MRPCGTWPSGATVLRGEPVTNPVPARERAGRVDLAAAGGERARARTAVSLGHQWRRQGRTPGDGLTVTPTPDGAVIHPAGVGIPAVVPVRCTPAIRGRTLHIAAGVDLTAVGAFVDSLPAGLRPANYTVAAGVTFDSA